MSSRTGEIQELATAVREGGKPKYHEANAARGKLFVRERLAHLLDEGSFIEDGEFANVKAGDLLADGVVTGLGRIDGRPVAIMANDSTVKAGSWGWRTVEKIIRIQGSRTEETVSSLVSGRLSRRSDHRSDRDVPRATRSRKDFLQSGSHVWRDSADLSPVRTFGRRGSHIPAFCDVVDGQ